MDPKAKNEAIQQSYAGLAAKYNPRGGGRDADIEKFEGHLRLAELMSKKQKCD